ncbi:uncharacterized protein LTR77_009960 [Saxophila tyrrhenica]|uniref:Cupin type-2 domain-containing protein n=1 Tax=Saxophila tyrrhenica TaxID=1690608 RepID=A0AAV9NXF3_9PEZI|nr:hypothetical protein LTR77_009960 [Saxophila tyrrhenica]
MSHYVTTHNDKGEATFSDKVPASPTQLPLPGGSMNILFTTHTTPTPVHNDSSIDQYTHDRTNGLGNAICPPNGTAAAIVSLQPDSEFPWHRTMTLDVVYVLEGTLELHLDSGEKRVLKQGDSVIQRAGMHKWVNITENGGWARTLGFAQPVVEPAVVGGKELKGEFIMG